MTLSIYRGTWDLAAAKQGETPVSNLELDLHPWSWTPHLLSLTPCRRSWTLHLLSCYLRLWSWNASPWSRTFYPWSWTQNVPLVTYHMPLEKDPIPLELDSMPLELKPCCLSPLITYKPLSNTTCLYSFIVKCLLKCFNILCTYLLLLMFSLIHLNENNKKHCDIMVYKAQNVLNIKEKLSFGDWIYKEKRMKMFCKYIFEWFISL